MTFETLRGKNAGLQPGKTPGSYYGTSRQSFLDGVTRSQIEAVFGAPTNDYGDWPMDDKTYTEWYVRFEDGTIGSIYDYRTQGAFRIGAYENDGHTTKLVRAALGLPAEEK